MQYKDYTEKSLNERRLTALLTPSWLSSLLAIFIGLLVTGGVILVFNFNNGPLKQQLISYEDTSTKQAALTVPGETPPAAKNSLQSTWPLIAFWGMIGLAVYFLVEFIIKVFGDAEEFSKELNYVHAKRNQLIRSALLGLVIRLIGAGLWLGFIDLFIKRVIPYSITAAQASVASPTFLYSVLYAVLSFAMVVFCLHINVIFLRFAARRPRIFTSVDYLDV